MHSMFAVFIDPFFSSSVKLISVVFELLSYFRHQRVVRVGLSQQLPKQQQYCIYCSSWGPVINFSHGDAPVIVDVGMVHFGDEPEPRTPEGVVLGQSDVYFECPFFVD